MRVPLSWLAEFVEVPADVDALRDLLDQAGLEVGEIEHVGKAWDHIVAARVLEATPIEGTHLWRVRLDVGTDEPRTAVSGAPNTPDTVGRLVAAALPGAQLHVPDGKGNVATIVVAERTLRGVRSQAVLCSERELGLSDDHSGLFVLTADVSPGRALAEVLGDTVFDIELTPDLGRCYSIFGVARELAALRATPLHTDALVRADVGTPDDGLVQIDIEDPAESRRYIGVFIDDIDASRPSPSWMQRRLLLAGMRPLNVVVDIANYVMLEVGQPLHFFDRERLRGSSISVRRARQGERMEALGGQVLELSPDVLVIADEDGPVAVAGIIGGAHSAVGSGTRRVLLEAAHFAPHRVRRGAQQLRLRTDAADRFIKGIDPEWTFEAMRRAVALLLELSPGARVLGWTESYPAPLQPRRVEVGVDDVERLLGICLEPEVLRAHLERFGFELEPLGEGRFVATAPSWRWDVEYAADLVEEVARAHGLDNIAPSEVTSAYLQADRLATDDVALERRLAHTLAAAGWAEVLNYSIVPEAWLEFRTPLDVPSSGPVRLRNPLSAERTVLRQSLVPGLVRNVADNLRHTDGVHVFELGQLYFQRDADVVEVHTAALVSAGLRRRAFWGEQTLGTGIGRSLHLFDIKGLVEATLVHAGIGPVEWEGVETPGLLPGQTLRAVHRGRAVAWVGVVDPQWAEQLDVEGVEVIAAEWLLAPFYEAARRVVHMEPLVDQPPVYRDIAIIVRDDVTAAQVTRAIEEAGAKHLRELHIFDRYRGSTVPEGHYSLAIHLVFQTPERTLTASEVDDDVALILSQLDTSLGARVRT